MEGRLFQQKDKYEDPKTARKIMISLRKSKGDKQRGPRKISCMFRVVGKC